MNTSPAIAAAFYQFATLPDFADKREPLKALCDERHVTGTILLAMLPVWRKFRLPETPLDADKRG